MSTCSSDNSYGGYSAAHHKKKKGDNIPKDPNWNYLTLLKIQLKVATVLLTVCINLWCLLILIWLQICARPPWPTAVSHCQAFFFFHFLKRHFPLCENALKSHLIKTTDYIHPTIHCEVCFSAHCFLDRGSKDGECRSVVQIVLFVILCDINKSDLIWFRYI